MLYPREIIEEVRMGNDIVDVVSTYIPLKQKGGNYFGTCPFHNEKTPSFSVSPDKQIFYCFGCGAGGNVITFIMQIENHDFLGALRLLADRIHYTLPEATPSAEMQKKAKTRETLVAIHKKAARFFYDNLSKKEGEVAVAYLNNRHIHPKARVKFGLGYSLAARDGLHKHLLSAGYAMDDILQSGLVIAGKNGGFFDRFQGRLMFPIFDVQNNVVGFGGRILKEGEPKYLNSPDTPLFDKSRNLYGINYARLSKAKSLILVEGYMDVISLYQAGFQNAVAALGTAFNREHCAVLKKYADSVFILFDSDEAGTNAAVRAIQVLLNGGLKIKVLQVKDAKDPDEYINKYGSEGFAQLLQAARSHVMFQVDLLKKKYDLRNTDEKVQFTIEAGKVVGSLGNSIERDAYIKEVAEYADISSDAIKEEINRISTSVQVNTKVRQNFNYKQQNKLMEKGLHEARKNILHIVAAYPFIARKLREFLAPEEMGEPVYSALLRIIYDSAAKGQALYPAELVNYFETVAEQQAAAVIFEVPSEYGSDRELEKAVNDLLKVIKKGEIDEKIPVETDMDKLNMLVESKRNIDKLYITIADG